LLALLGAHHILYVSRIRVNYYAVETYGRVEGKIQLFLLLIEQAALSPAEETTKPVSMQASVGIRTP
jgi:hypothetical protein